MFVEATENVIILLVQYLAYLCLWQSGVEVGEKLLVVELGY